MCDTPKQIQPIPSTLEALQLVLSRCDEFATPQRFEQLLDAVVPNDHLTPVRAADPIRRAELATSRLNETWQGGQNALLALVRQVAAGYPAHDQRCRALRLLDRRLTAELEASGEAAWRRGEHYLALLEQRPTARLLAEYLAERRPVGHHEQIEWRLAELALDTPLEDLALEQGRPDLAKRRAGAALLWALSQRLRRPGPPAECLMTGTPLAVRQAGIVARAWALWPDNPCFREEAICARLVDWLVDCGHPLEPILTLVMKAGHPGLAAACVRRWPGGLSQGTAPETLRLMLERPASHDEGLDALRRAMFEAAQQPDRLRTLGRLAFEQRSYTDVLTTVALLPDTVACEEEVVAWHIAALAATEDYQAAALCYASDWPDTPAQPPFPYPQLLLPALRTPETQPLRQRLLRSADLKLLDRYEQLEALVARGRADETLEAWQALLWGALGQDTDAADWRAALVAHPDTLELLIQLTEACIQSRADGLARQNARTLWQALRDDLWSLSAAALVLLALDNTSCMAIYEQRLLPYPLQRDRWSHRAAARYLAALAHEHRWQQVRRFVGRPDFPQLLGQLSAVEYRYWRLLRDLEQAIAEQQPMGEYSWLWEEALCLALPDDYVLLLVEHFNDHRPRCGSDNTLVFEDLSPHIERRGKALCERLLIRRPALCQRRIQARLRTADLDMLAPLLNDMTCCLEVCHDCVGSGPSDHTAGGDTRADAA
ncbi:MAG TPA: hypothetical protein VFS21_33390 [Roseiflexaceae bacterium]|nr:hypothetical protein [Roseiflexaceae bacterium]